MFHHWQPSKVYLPNQKWPIAIISPSINRQYQCRHMILIHPERKLPATPPHSAVSLSPFLPQILSLSLPSPSLPFSRIYLPLHQNLFHSRPLAEFLVRPRTGGSLSFFPRPGSSACFTLMLLAIHLKLVQHLWRNRSREEHVTWLHSVTWWQSMSVDNVACRQKIYDNKYMSLHVYNVVWKRWH